MNDQAINDAFARYEKTDPIIGPNGRQVGPLVSPRCFRAGYEAALADQTAPQPKAGEVEAVAWRVKDFADGWISSANREAVEEARNNGHVVQPLFVSPAPSKPDVEAVRLRRFLESLLQIVKPTGDSPEHSVKIKGERFTGPVADSFVNTMEQIALSIESVLTPPSEAQDQVDGPDTTPSAAQGDPASSAAPNSEAQEVKL